MSCIEVKDIAQYKENDSELAKYTISKLQEENKKLQEYVLKYTDVVDQQAKTINELEKCLLELRLTDVDGKTIVYRLLDKLKKLKGEQDD